MKALHNFSNTPIISTQVYLSTKQSNLIISLNYTLILDFSFLIKRDSAIRRYLKLSIRNKTVKQLAISTVKELCFKSIFSQIQNKRIHVRIIASEDVFPFFLVSVVIVQRITEVALCISLIVKK